MLPPPRAPATPLLAGALILAVAWAAAARPGVAQEPGPPLRVGLALSGGSAKGFAHIGVLRVLEELEVPVDLVTGTSMGSLVGALYAIGMGPDEIQTRLTELDWVALFSDERPRSELTVDRRLAGERSLLSFPIRGGRVGLPTGVVRGERGTRALQLLTWRALAMRDFQALPTPFAAVATDIETGEAVILREGVLADAIRASIAIPGVIRPFRVGDRLLVDGAIARNLPAQDARAMGADVVICSDVSGPLARADELGSLFDVLLQTVSFQMQASTAQQRRLCDVLVDVDVNGLSAVAFGEGEAWIRRGEDAARALSDTLRALARRTAGHTPRPTWMAGFLADSIAVARVEVQGARGRSADLARRVAGLEGGSVMDAGDLDRAVGRLYATDLFEQVSYRVSVRGRDTVVVLDLQPQPQDRLGFGFRYDDRQQAALLFAASLHNRPLFGAATHVELRLGEEVELGGRMVRGFGLLSRFSLEVDARHTRAVFERFEERRRVASFRARVTALSGFVGVALGRTTVAGTRLTLERATSGTVIAPSDTTRSATVVSATARIFRDTFDRSAYPTRGIRLLLSSEWSDRSVLGGATFRLHHARVDQLVPVADGTTVRLSGLTGLGQGDDLPLHRLFFLGGAYPSAVLGETRPAFPGLRPDERSGQAVHLLAVAVQQRLTPQIFLTVGARTGIAGDDWHAAPSAWERGWSLALGALSPLGPLEVTVAGREKGNPMMSVNLGFAF